MAKTDNLNDFLVDIAEGIQLAENESTPYTINPQDFRAHINTLKKVSGTKTITSAGTHDVTSYANAQVGAGALTASGSATAVTTVAPGTVTIAQNSATVSGKTKVSVTPTTATNTIGTYYMAIQANAAANGTGATSSITGTATAKGSTAGYITTSSSATAAISGTATAKTSAKSSSVYYLPITSGAVTASGSATATVTVAPGAVTIAANTTAVNGKTRVAATPTTATSGISTYYIAVKANAAANTTGATTAISGTATAKGSTAGYIATSTSATAAISGTATAKTSSKDSSVYYLPLASGKYTVAGGGLTSGAGTVSAAITATGITLGSAVTATPSSGPYIKVSGSGKVSMAAVTATQTAGYLPASTTAATLVSAVPNKSSNTATIFYPITGVSRANTTIGVTANSTNKTLTVTATNNQPQGYQAGGNKTATATVTLSSSSNTVTASVGTISVATTIGTAFSGTTIAPNRTTQIAVSAGRYTTGNVYIGAIPENLVDTTSGTATAGEILSGKKAWVDGSEVTGTIATKTSSNLTASGAKVTVPAGYYATAASKTISGGAAAVSGGGLSASTGSVSATSGGVVLIATASKPSSGYYITATGSGKVSQATITLSKSAGYIAGGTSTYKAATTISSSTVTAHYVIPTQEKEVTPTTSQQIITPDSGKLLSQVVVNGYTPSTGITLNVFIVKITSSVGNATAYYTAGDGRQYTKALSSTQQTMYVAEETTLRIVGPNGTYCKLNGNNTYSQATDGNIACMYFPTSLIPLDPPVVTLTLDATAAKVDTSSGNAAAADIFNGKKAWVDGVEVTGTMPQINLPQPVITINTNTGAVSAYVDMEDETPGYVSATAYSSASRKLTTKAGGTIKPSTTATQTWAKGTFLTSTLTVAKEANLLPENIKTGVAICGVTGTYTGSGGASLSTYTAEVKDLDWCGGVTVTTIVMGTNGNLTSAVTTVATGGTVTVTAVKGTPLYINAGDCYGGITVCDAEYDRVSTTSYYDSSSNTHVVNQPQDGGEHYIIDVFG